MCRFGQGEVEAVSYAVGGCVRRVREGGIMSSPSRSERVEGRREGGTAGRKRGGPYRHTAGDCFPRVSCSWESASAPVSQGKSVEEEHQER